MKKNNLTVGFIIYIYLASFPYFVSADTGDREERADERAGLSEMRYDEDIGADRGSGESDPDITADNGSTPPIGEALVDDTGIYRDSSQPAAPPLDEDKKFEKGDTSSLGEALVDDAEADAGSQ